MQEAMWHIFSEITGYHRRPYKIIALFMLFIGGLAAYTFVWDLGDVGIGLMTIFNIILLYPQGEKALKELKKYEESKKHRKERPEK